jgi:hypothetical protein
MNTPDTPTTTMPTAQPKFKPRWTWQSEPQRISPSSSRRN